MIAPVIPVLMETELLVLMSMNVSQLSMIVIQRPAAAIHKARSTASAMLVTAAMGKHVQVRNVIKIINIKNAIPSNLGDIQGRHPKS